MISVEEALMILEKNVRRLDTEMRPVQLSNGYVLCEAVVSPIDMPSFNQSAMDGYACHFVAGKDTYNVVGEVAAGSSDNPHLNVGDCVRIFTGAMVPDKANTVIQQEWTAVENNQMRIIHECGTGQNIRFAGEQIAAGDIALDTGAVLNPAAIGFLTSLGITEIPVYRKPKISLITTGNELVKPGKPLKKGQIYESNSAMLVAAINAYGFDNYTVHTVADNYEATRSTIKEALNSSDCVILTGGISVGDYDFVGKALNELGVETLFYKVKQKPGKPIYMGRLENALVAALPGNPAAALTCFYRYVLPTLNFARGLEFQGLKSFSAPMSEAYEKRGNRAEFLKARFDNGTLSVLGAQSSAMLRSFAEANALVYIPEAKASIEKGEIVTAYQLSS